MLSPLVCVCKSQQNSLQRTKAQEQCNRGTSPQIILCLPMSVPLQADLAAADSKRAAAESKVAAAETDAKTAKKELSALEKQLSKASSGLETAQSKLTRAERDLAAAKAAADEASGAGSSCKVSLEKAHSRISEQASRLDELKAVEEALLPVWLSRRLIKAQTWTAVQLKALKESDMAAQAAAKVAPYYEQAAAKVAPYWDQAMETSKPAREAAAVYFQKAKVGTSVHRLACCCFNSLLYCAVQTAVK